MTSRASKPSLSTAALTTAAMNKPTKAKSIAAAKVTRKAQTSRNQSPARAKTKLSIVVAMLREKRGASLDQIVKATGWQRHTVRGAISGSIKKKLGLKVVSERQDDNRVYRIVG